MLLNVSDDIVFSLSYMTHLTAFCLQDLFNDWESQQSRVQELNKSGSELESLIIDITTPQTKTGKSSDGDTDRHVNTPTLPQPKLVIFQMRVFLTTIEATCT